ncbi:hypothetical protein WA171_004944, partial [Blastocystis sp. BT1]
MEKTDYHSLQSAFDKEVEQFEELESLSIQDYCNSLEDELKESNDQLHRLTERVTELESELDGIILQMASGYMNESESDRNRLLKQYKETIDEKQKLLERLREMQITQETNKDIILHLQNRLQMMHNEPCQLPDSKSTIINYLEYIADR